MFEKRGIPFVLLDVVCLVLGGLPLAAFNLGKVRPYQRGFFCNDDSIKYPFHHSTITSTVLYTVGFALPISCVFFVSDFFKPRVDLCKKVDIPHTSLQETPTNGNHFESQLS
ncbi:hypothetical protein fugu_019318 [Takifugu bimaculatus]|uniref:Phosphatidic acid phosphatase type 2/haloperoxidase domain-containing protein n=1 Tax=Takifugu bimaculatus TaxID=433685 RepID=A0A4Z2BL71_9TELE|nr:hypothetical protein fugu_019318 [Takifugu bimaculatus]